MQKCVCMQEECRYAHIDMHVDDCSTDTHWTYITCVPTHIPTNFYIHVHRCTLYTFIWTKLWPNPCITNQEKLTKNIDIIRYTNKRMDMHMYICIYCMYMCEYTHTHTLRKAAGDTGTNFQFTCLSGDSGTLPWGMCWDNVVYWYLLFSGHHARPK